MTAALPTGVVIGVATYTTYLLTLPSRDAGATAQTQASTAALITLLLGALWVLAVVARPYQWWRICLVLFSMLSYVVIFALPIARQKFMIDPSNVSATTTAVLIGLLAAALIEALWWIQGRLLGEPRRVWR
jgi:cation-transporting ATPase E